MHRIIARVVWLFACLNLCVDAAYGHGDSGSLYEIPLQGLSDITVVTTSRYARKVFEAPGIVTVVTADEIEKFGANNLAEVMERLPSVTPLTGYVFKNNAMSVRGDLPNQNDTHLLILVNGRPYRTGFSGSFNGVIFDALPVESIARLEFVRGPGSVLYGSNAYSGVLNIITKQPNDSSRGLSFQAGSFETRRASGYGAYQQGEFGVRTNITALDTDGWRLEMEDELGVDDADDFDEQHYALMSSAYWRNFNADLLLMDTTQTHFGSVPRWPSQEIDRNAYLLGLGHQYAMNDAWTLHSSVTLSSSRQAYPQANPANPSWKFDAETDEANLEVYANGRISDEHSLLLGASVSRLQGDIGGGQITLPDYDLTWSSLYAQLDYQLSDALQVFVGGQWNKAENVDGEFVPRLGAIYRINPVMGVKALYSEAFRSPFPAETDIQALPVLEGNENLQPELVETYDLQWFYDTGTTQASLTWFHTEQKDLIDRISGGPGMPGTFENVGERKIQGLELEWHIKPTTRWEFIGSVLYQRNEDGDGEDDVTLAPDYLVKFGAIYKPSKGFSLGVFDAYTDDYQNTRIVKPNSTQVNPAADGYHLLSANARFRLGHWLPDSAWKRVGLSLYGTNLLDEEVYVPEYSRDFINTLPARPGRAVFLTLDVNL